MTSNPALPRALHPGGSVFVWAPSSPAPAVFPNRFRRGVEGLERAGYQVTGGTSCDWATGPSTLPPEAVAKELHAALDDHDAIVAAVGGWTLLPVLPHLDLDRIAAARRPIVGYSDVTSLLNVVAYRAGLVTFHGPMVLSEWGEAEGPWDYTAEMFRRAVGGGWEELVVEPAGAWTDELLWWDREDLRRRRPRAEAGAERRRVVQPGAGTGRLWGGSLVTLGLLAGTPFWPHPHAAVIFLEAEAMAPDELWSRLEQLRLAGVFDEAVAVVLGRHSRPTATVSGFSDFDAVVRNVVPPGVPVLAGVDLGHTEPMCSLPIGAMARVTCGDGQGELRLLGPVVA